MMNYLLARYAPGQVEVLGSVMVQLIYIAFGLLIEHKIRPAYNSKTTRKMLIHSMRNHVVATLIHVGYVVYHRGESVLTRTFIPPYRLPPLTEAAMHLVLAFMLRDVVFWVIHRIWHLPGIYDLIHEKHHQVLTPGEHHILTISYMSVVDFVVLYGLPIVGVAKLLEMDIFVTLLYAFVSAAGEQVKLVCGDEMHDEHHLDGRVNFGAYGITDWLFGTVGTGK